MKLVFYEFKKIFSFRIFVICLVAFFALNIGLIWYSQSENQSAKLAHTNIQKYNELIEKYSDTDYETALDDIAEKMLVGEIAANIYAASTSDDPDMALFIEEQIRQFSEMYPTEYQSALSIIANGYDETYYSFISEISDKLQYVNDYDVFINQMEQRANNKLKFSVFSQDDGYSEKNIEKTLADFQQLNGITVQIGNDYSIVGATTFRITDYFIFALIILLCIGLFVTEKDKSLFTIVKSTKNGYFPTIAAKLAALLISVLFISVLFALSDIAACGWYSGIGNLSRNIQSVREFINCSFDITIWQYLLVWILSKAFVMCAVAAIFAAVFVLLKSNSVTYIITLAFLAAEYVLYSSIDSNAMLNHFKYINIFAFVWDNNIIGSYLNLNFFGTPVSLFPIFVITTLLILLLFCLLAVLFYVKNIAVRGDKFVSLISAKASSFFSAHFNSVRLFNAEWHKYFFKGTTVFLLLFLILFAYSQYSASIELKFYDAADSCYAGYMNRLSGEITDETVEFLNNEQEYFAELEAKYSEISADDNLSVTEKGIKTSAISATLQGKGEAFNMVMEQYDYAMEIAKRYNTSPYLIDENISEILLLNYGRDWEYFALFLAVMIVSLSGIFSYEYKKKFVSILRSTRKGQINLIVCKIFVAIISATAAYTLVYLPFTINFINTYGSDMLSIPLIFVSNFSGANSTITIFQFIVFISIARIFTFFAAIMAILAVSVILKNNAAAMVVSTVITILPCLIFINNNAVRLSASFSSGTWAFAVPITIALSVAIAAISLIIIMRKFGGISMPEIRRCKYGINSAANQQNL